MMRLSRLISLSILALIMITISCSQQPPQPLELNQGEKWQIIPEMITHIRASEKLFSDYTLDSDTDFKKLAEGLTENNKKLIKSCTMKGPAHDELHKWLPPHLKLVAELGDATSTEKASKTIEKLKMSFEALDTYFE